MAYQCVFKHAHYLAVWFRRPTKTQCWQGKKCRPLRSIFVWGTEIQSLISFQWTSGGKQSKVAPHQSMQHGSSPEAVKGATKCGSGAGPENCGGPDLDEYCSIHRRSELHDWSRPNEDLRKTKKSFVILWSIAHHSYKFPSKGRSWLYSYFLLTHLLSKLKYLPNRWQMYNPEHKHFVQMARCASFHERTRWSL